MGGPRRTLTRSAADGDTQVPEFLDGPRGAAFRTEETETGAHALPAPDATSISTEWSDEQLIAWQFPAMPLHARLARKWIERWLTGLWPDSQAAPDATVAFSEVVTNAVLHGIGPIRVAARADDDYLYCEVGDGSPERPKNIAATDDDDHGRGLSLIEALIVPGTCRVQPRSDGGKVVSFCVGSRRTAAASTERERPQR